MPKFIILLLVVLFPFLSVEASDSGPSYSNVLKNKPEQEVLKNQQRAWPAEVKKGCEDIACISEMYSSQPVTTYPFQVAEVQRGLYHTCVRFVGGSVKCWGDNHKGQLGTGNYRPSLVPVAVPDVLDANSLWVGYDATCVIRQGGGVACWGVNLKDEAVSGSYGNRAIDIPDISDAVKVSFGSTHACVLLRSGGVRCWGRNDHGELGQGNTDDGYWMHGDSVLVPLIAPATDIFTEDDSSCALLTKGEVHCWGDLVVGSDRRRENRVLHVVSEPTRVRGVSNAIAISSGLAQCALIRTGQVRCWGDNRNGELGDNTVRSRAFAAPVLGIRGAKQLLWGMCAVLDSGSLAYWGSDYGSWSNDDPNQFHNPTVAEPTSILRGATSYFLRYQDFCAVMPDGRVHCNQKVCDKSFDFEVGNLVDAVSISVENSTGCALTRSHGVLCWGDNSYGMLGNGNSDNNNGFDRCQPPVASPVVGLTDP